MVGVPGRSKGCATCRRRRKGCDLHKPVCGQCKKSKLDCTGWTRERVFVNATQSNSVTQYNLALAGEGQRVTLHPNLTRTAYWEKYLEIFWTLYYPPGEASEASVLRAYAAGTWTSVAKDLYHDRPTVRMALLAHCLATVGRSEDKRWLLLESLRFYTAALGRVREDLLHVSKWRDDAVVVASRALASYEILYGQECCQGQLGSNQAQNWQAYNRGDETLLLQRSPFMHQKGTGFDLFVDGRMQLLISAIVRRKKTFLSNEEWKTVPWKKQDKTPRDRLLDTAAEVPGLLEDLDRCCNLPSSKLYGALLHTISSIDEGLNHWAETGAPMSHLRDLQDRGFDTASRGDIAVTEVMTIYWSMCILTYSALEIVVRLSPDLASSSPVIGQLATLPRTRPRQYCALIADAVGVFFQPTAGAMFAKSAAFPIGVTLGYLMSTEGLGSRDGQTLLGYFTKGSQGKAVGAFIKGTVKEWGPDFPKSKEGSLSMAEGRFAAG